MALLATKGSGEFANGLARCRQAALVLHERMKADPRFLTAFPPELDIIIWVPNAKTSSEITALSKDQFDRSAEANLHLATIKLPVELLRSHWSDVIMDTSDVLCLRSCLMKPEHLDWVDKIWKVLDRVSGPKV